MKKEITLYRHPVLGPNVYCKCVDGFILKELKKNAQK